MHDSIFSASAQNNELFDINAASETEGLTPDLVSDPNPNSTLVAGSSHFNSYSDHSNDQAMPQLTAAFRRVASSRTTITRALSSRGCTCGARSNSTLVQEGLSPQASRIPEKHVSKSNDVDPYSLVSKELKELRDNLFNLLGAGQPELTDIASYYFKHPSKQLRPLIVLLFAQATNGLGSGWHEKRTSVLTEPGELDRPLSRPDVLNDWNPAMPDHTESFSTTFSMMTPSPKRLQRKDPSPKSTRSPSAEATGKLVSPPFILPTQIRMAQIIEMIHVASLLHDDVIDASPLRRNAPSAPAAFGSKYSVLAGNFLLGRASLAISRLGSPETVESCSSAIANLVEGEVLQLREVLKRQIGEKQAIAPEAPVSSESSRVPKETWNKYLQKSYMKTASLIARGARAAAVLGGCEDGEIWKEVAHAYGRNLGIAFQVHFSH